MSQIDLNLDDLAKQLEVLHQKLEATKKAVYEDIKTINIPIADRMFLEEAMEKAIKGELDVATFADKIKNMKKWD